MTEAQFELLLAANREHYEELQAIHHALRRLRGISYAVYGPHTWSPAPHATRVP
jgi:hypothetical protein